MNSTGIDVIATTISGSIRDWGKVERIVPLFREHGRTDVQLHVAESHQEAQRKTEELVRQGSRTLISAGGSGTFRSVLEGCIRAGIGLGELRLGFLRKGSADLIGKVLGMPDDIEEAIRVFTESLASGRTVPCDVLQARGGGPGEGPRHFVGYGGAGIFGRIPHYTENRWTKYYKGVLSQLFGDLGPFFVGTSLSVAERSLKRLWQGREHWQIRVDGQEVAAAPYQALILVNGDLGPDLPFARAVPLGSGDFHLFGLRDLGILRIPGQLRRAWSASILEDPERHGFESYRIEKKLELLPAHGRPFPINVDGSTLTCTGSATFQIIDRIPLISRS